MTQIRWKVNLCPPIEKPPLEQERSAEAQAARKKLDAPAPGFPHKAGTAALSRLWQHEAERPEDAVKLHGTNADVEQMFEEIRKQDGLLEFRKEELRDEGKTDPKDWQNDAELQQIQEVRDSACHKQVRGSRLTLGLVDSAKPRSPGGRSDSSRVNIWLTLARSE